LCASHHADYDGGRIPRQSIANHKMNLAVLNHRYSSLERRLMERFQDLGPTAGTSLVVRGGMEVLTDHLVKDLLVTRQILSSTTMTAGGGIVIKLPIRLSRTSEPPIQTHEDDLEIPDL